MYVCKITMLLYCHIFESQCDLHFTITDLKTSAGHQLFMENVHTKFTKKPNFSEPMSRYPPDKV